jgi:hypothetical protein
MATAADATGETGAVPGVADLVAAADAEDPGAAVAAVDEIAVVRDAGNLRRYPVTLRVRRESTSKADS